VSGSQERRRVMKLGVLVSHPIQYQVPVFRSLARASDVDFTVVYRTRRGVDPYYDAGFAQELKWDIPLLGGYTAHFLSAKTHLTGFEPAILRELVRLRPDVLIVHGYNSPTNVVAMLVAKALGTRVMVRGDTRIQRGHSSLKRCLKQLLFRTVDGFLTVGTLNRKYYEALGAEPHRLFHAPFCVDNALFTTSADESRKRRERWRERHNLPQDAVVVLYASKLSKYKRPADLVRAFAQVSRRSLNAWLVIAGSGAEEDALKAAVRADEVERVRFVGFQNQSVLPDLYAASDCFVLPSDEEPWGLVINEVMAAGLPVIASDGVGAVPDLVQGKGTGLVYPCGDVDALAEALELLINDDAMRIDMGEKARRLIGAWDVDVCAANTLSAAMHLPSV
jgi:glycosyltransferase involved in cell wall biosynthesis